MSGPQGYGDQPYNAPAPYPGQPMMPPPPMQSLAPKVSMTWTGAVLALGAVLAGVGSFLPWEKLVYFLNGRVLGSVSITGLGSQSLRGRTQVLTVGNGGKVILALAVVLLIAAVLILAKQGRLWVGIVALVLSLAAIGLMIANYTSIGDDDTKLGRQLRALGPGLDGNALVKIGIYLSLAGAIVMAVGALAAVALRRRR